MNEGWNKVWTWKQIGATPAMRDLRGLLVLALRAFFWWEIWAVEVAENTRQIAENTRREEER
jgi:hypothetical protein